MTTRRNFLRGAGGITVGLPFLPSLMRSAKADCDAGTRRLVVIYQPQGMIMEEWHPTGTGSNFELSPILAPLEPHKQDIVVVSGLDNRIPMAFGNSYGHPGACKSIYTGMPLSVNMTPDGNVLPPEQTPTEVDAAAGAGGPSIEQVIASRMAAATPYESLGFAVGRTDYHEVIASFYTGRDEVLGLEPDPRAAFDRLFADLDPGEPSPLQRLRAARGSVLDAVADSYESVSNRLSNADRLRLEAHAAKIRELELRFGNGSGGQGCARPEFSLPANYDPQHSDFDDVGGRAQIDNLVMSLACDLTRVASLQFMEGQDNRFPWLGHPFPFTFDGWHGIFHIVPEGPTGREDPVVRPAMIDAMRWYADMFAYLVQRLAETPDGDGTMLDSTLVVWATEMGDGDGHNTVDIPVVLAGNLCGALETGRHLEYYGRSTNDLLVSMLNIFGYEDQSFGWAEMCDGPLPGLA